MTCERQLDARREDPDSRVPVSARREHENRLREADLECKSLHGLRLELATVREHRELVSRQCPVREDVGEDVAERRHRCTLLGPRIASVRTILETCSSSSFATLMPSRASP